MVRPTQDAIDTFVGITGADEAVAARKLEEHHGDLNEAVNAYFNEGDRTSTRANENPIPTGYDDMELDEPFGPVPTFHMPLGNPFSFLDQGFLERAAAVYGEGPHITHPREVRRIDVEVKDNNTPAGSSGHGPVIEDVTGHEFSHGPEIRGTVAIDEDDDDDNLPSAQDTRLPSNPSSSNYSVPRAPPIDNVSDYNNDIEEEMVRAAIEASKRDADGLTNGLRSGERENASRGRDDDEIARAVSMSLETAERERVLRQVGAHVSDHSDLSDKEDIEGATGTVERQVPTSGKVGTSDQLVDEENFQDDDVEEHSFVRQHSRHVPSGNDESTEALERANSHPSSLLPHNIENNHQFNGVFPSEVWGGISSEEHDEAVMLEAAMFGGIPGRAAYPFSLPYHQNSSRYPTVAHPPSPTLTAQRLLWEQQDDEYLASLEADREKELKAEREAELRRLEAAAEREAAIAKQKQEEEEKRRKQLEEEELESKLAAKQASLPKEPLPDDVGAITVVVRMPDGRRQGRCFMKSDNLQVLFDFIDISRTFKPGTYRLVRSYPRRAFTDSESQMSLSDLGLNSKQEALFLEQISG
uniref:UBX domain-containing protein n=1 Tax=Oryza meridionalis TaxID=40149 RepID=A0A0E0ENN0_9ORYZ